VNFRDQEVKGQRHTTQYLHLVTPQGLNIHTD